VNTIVYVTSNNTIDQKERIKIWFITTIHHSREAWSIYSRNKLAVFGLALLFIYVLITLIYPALLKTKWPKRVYDPVVGHDMMIFPHPSPPSTAHLLGTDTLGRDVLSRLMAATLPSLRMALTAALTSAIVGTLIAAISANYRGLVDNAFSGLADLSLMVPAPIVMVIIGFVLDISDFHFGLIYGLLVGVGAVAIVLRSHAITIMTKSFIDAARMSGGGGMYIATRHLIPHLLPLAAVNMLLTVTGAIFANGFIAFLGLSRAQLNWGSMIYDSFTYQQINGTITWNVLVPSALFISLFAASFYFIALGLHDVVDPRQAERSSPIRVKGEKKQILKIPWRFSKPELKAPDIYEYKFPAEKHTTKEFQLATDLTNISPRIDTATVVFEGIQSSFYECFPISVMLIKLIHDNSLTATSTGMVSESIESIMDRIDTRILNLGGWVKILDHKSLIASYGLTAHTPAQASSLQAARVGLELKDLLNDDPQRRNDELINAKICVGIACGEINLLPKENSDLINTLLSSEPGLVAKTLSYFSGFMKNGGVLICENTFRHLYAVQHHFVFGRKGMAQLPVEKGEGMVYEISGYNLQGKKNELSKQHQGRC